MQGCDGRTAGRVVAAAVDRGRVRTEGRAGGGAERPAGADAHADGGARNGEASNDEWEPPDADRGCGLRDPARGGGTGGDLRCGERGGGGAGDWRLEDGSRRPRVDAEGMFKATQVLRIQVVAAQRLLGPVSYTHLTLPTSDLV